MTTGRGVLLSEGMRALPFVLGVALGLPFAIQPKDARASVSIAILYDQLVERSAAVVVVTPLEQNAAWEGRKLYTYTRVRVESVVAGDLAVGSETWVRTLGGVIGNVAQAVEGEPTFDLGSSTLVFMHHVQKNLYGVVARAQGQFFFTEDTKTRAKMLKRHARPGMLVPPPAKAAETVQPKPGAVTPKAVTPAPAEPELASRALEGKNLDEVTKDVKAAFERTHAR